MAKNGRQRAVAGETVSTPLLGRGVLPLNTPKKYPAGDSAALAEAIVRLTGSPELREQLTAAGLERARELRERRPSWRDLVLQALGE